MYYFAEWTSTSGVGAGSGAGANSLKRGRDFNLGASVSLVQQHELESRAVVASARSDRIRIILVVIVFC